MFSGIWGKILIVLYILVLLAIPVGAYLVSQNQNPKANAKSDSQNQNPLANLKPLTSTPSASTKPFTLSTNDTIPEPSSSPVADVSFGPTLSLKVILQGRPAGKMSTKLFVGIAEGTVSTQTPKYLLSFNIDLPDSGIYTGLSLAGLNPGTNYTAVLKGPTQVATASAFTMSPSTTNLNGGSTITLITGDLNEDNVINSADYTVAKAAYGATSSSQNWNANVDFNADGVINVADLGILIKNMNTTGQAGVWQSTPSSGGLATESATASGNPQQGYWFWMPSF